MNKYEEYLHNNPLARLPPIPGKGWWVYLGAEDAWFRVAWFCGFQYDASWEDLDVGFEHPRGVRITGIISTSHLYSHNCQRVIRLRPKTGRYGMTPLKDGDFLEFVP